jgi:hypothetical protein
MRHPLLLTALTSLACVLSCQNAIGQTSPAPMPRDYRGVTVRVGGVFVTPVPNAPFSATVDIVSREKLPDGSLNIRMTTAHIARDAAGRIYNERRAMVSAAFSGEPQLLSAHIYDPNTRLSTIIDPSTHLARQSMVERPWPAAQSSLPDFGSKAGAILAKEENIGEQTLEALTLTGIRKTWNVSAATSGTGRAEVIVDQYWYSPELSMYVLMQHDDPRTGEQIVALKDIRRGEPEASLFAIPAKYRTVDETPER